MITERKYDSLSVGGDVSKRPAKKASVTIFNGENIDPNMFVVDKDHLDDDWEQQSINCYSMGLYVAQCRMAWEELKRELEVKRAATEHDIRKNPEAFGLAKVTEATVASAVQINSGVEEVSKRCINAKYKLDQATAAMTALEHKKAALDGLTRLANMNYYSVK